MSERLMELPAAIARLGELAEGIERHGYFITRDRTCAEAIRSLLSSADIRHALALLSAKDARIAELTTALEGIADTIGTLRKQAEEQGRKLDGAQAYSLSLDPQFLRGLARRALATTKDGDQ